MKKVILTKGLPGSGKSTWAKKVVDDNPGVYKRINRDDIRAMLDNGKWSANNEKFVVEVRNTLILLALSADKNVIIDDTNLDPKNEKGLRELVKGKANIIIKDFTDIPLETCIERDLKRFASVGEKVIKGMYDKYLKVTETYIESQGLPRAILVDIDGTLAHMSGRTPFSWDRVKEDLVDNTIKNIVNTYGGKVIVLSGRDGICREDTIEWLKDNQIHYHELFMRDVNNMEKDAIIKRRLFETHIRGKYYIEFVLDDRNQVVDMWRDMGLKCLQVQPGDF